MDAEKLYTLNVSINDYLAETPFPWSIQAPLNGLVDSLEKQSLQDLFISKNRLVDLAFNFKTQIIQKLAPGLQKEGYEASATGITSEERSAQPRHEGGRPWRDPLRDGPLPPPAQPRPYRDPGEARLPRPFPAGDFPPPDFEDEYEIRGPARRGGFGGGGQPPNIGERDLYPPGLGPHDPLGGGGYGGVGGFGGGGMHPTFDDPLFGGDGNGGRLDPRCVFMDCGGMQLS